MNRYVYFSLLFIIYKPRQRWFLFNSRETFGYPLMENLHRTFDEENLDFEIDDLMADLIRAFISVKLDSKIGYDELTVIQFSGQRCTVMVDATGQRIEFGLT